MVDPKLPSLYTELQCVPCLLDKARVIRDYNNFDDLGIKFINSGSTCNDVRGAWHSIDSYMTMID